MRFTCAQFVVGCLTGVVLAQAPDTVFLEDLTWTEVRDALAEGTTTVIIPTGGTEQNGPHMVLGTHNFLVKHKAGEVARRLGDALVAPVMAYVPEGDVDPPTGHMRFPGTITTPPEVFEQVLEFAARSFRQHGFRDIALLGDSGGNQASQAAVADRVIPGFSQRHHDVPPAVGGFREALEQQHTRTVAAFETGLEHVNPEAVDVVHVPGADSGREHVVGVRPDLGGLRRR